MAALLSATGKQYKPGWLRAWFNSSAAEIHQSWIIPSWIDAAKCDRRSFDAAKRTLRTGITLGKSIFRTLARFANRKMVDRWVYRFLRTEVKRPDGIDLLGYLLEAHSTKRTVALAIDLIRQNAIARSDPDLLLAMLHKTNDPDLISAVKEQVQKYPNAPMSLYLMCVLDEVEPDFATPWIEEWNKTAMPWPDEDE